MNVLFWLPPWAAHGDPIFFRNCLRKHLAPQANLLLNAGWSVDFFLPEFLSSERSLLDNNIRVIEFSIERQIAAFGDLSDPSVTLYATPTETQLFKIRANLAPILREDYDFVLLWETPVPFLEEMYPDALIVHQMPGAFSRPPYPHTVTFDPVGLYKKGALYNFAEAIQQGVGVEGDDFSLARDFVAKVRDSITAIQPFDRKSLDPKQRFSSLALLPLQVSAHYSFQADTPYANQMEFLLDVLRNADPTVGVVVTQYVTPRVADTVLNKEVLPALQKAYPNLIYREEFDRVSSVSQYLLPLVDQVITCSSSLGLQALAWVRQVRVPQATFLAPFSTPEKLADGMDESERALNTLSFILGKYQPLASAVVSDQGFLTGLLSEMLRRKRAGAKGLDLFPSFDRVDPTYRQRLLAAFTTERAERDLSRSGERWAARQSELAKFRRAVADPDVEAITFDVFDTLIKRPTEVPADAYKYLEKKALEITQGVAEDFASVRLNAEVSTREATDKGEISLEEIYCTIRQHYGLGEQEIERLIEAEIDLEIALVQPRAFGERCWSIAQSSRKPIYLISDMYLSIDVIERMLEKTGYRDYKRLFLSSEHGVRKKEGGLFDLVLDFIQLKGQRVLHVGDNKVADIEQAQARGMKTFRLLRAVDRMRGNDFYKVIYPPKSGVGERARSAIAGLTAHALFDSPSGEYEKTTHFQGNAHHLGYAGLGPLVTGFMLWLGRQSRRDAITRLYFLSREGWLLKQVYDALHGDDPDAPPSAYLYASRRATRVASLRGVGDVLALAGQPYRAGVAVGELIENRFGLSATEVTADAWSDAGYAGAGDLLDTTATLRMKFSRLCSLNADAILQAARDERAAYLDYLDRAGLAAESNPGVVDIGWKGNMQGALGSLLGRPLNGYYYATLQGAELWKQKGHRLWAFMGDLLAAEHPSTVVNHRRLLEYLTCHVEGSLIRIERQGASLVPVFRVDENHGVRRQFIEEVHQGCIQFARDFAGEYGRVKEQIWIDPFLGERALASYFESPRAVDAQLLVGHYFEDALGGISKKYIIHPSGKRALSDSVWKQGAMAVFAQEKGSPPKKAAPVQSVPQKTPGAVIAEQVNSNTTCDATSRRFLEDILIRTVASKRKYEKYKRDRKAFFEDSNNRVVKYWYRVVG